MVPTDHGYEPKRKLFSNALLDDISQLVTAKCRTGIWLVNPLLDSSTWQLNNGQPLAKSGTIHDTWRIRCASRHRYPTQHHTVFYAGKGLCKPIVDRTQIPCVNFRSDGRDNLINSIIIAAGRKTNEVSLYFAGKLLRGQPLHKIADELTAFSSPNYPLRQCRNWHSLQRLIKLWGSCSANFHLTESWSGHRSASWNFSWYSVEPFEQIIVRRLSGGSSLETLRRRQYSQ